MSDNNRTSELLALVTDFYEQRPEADCVDAMAELATVGMVMIAASYPANEQQAVFDALHRKMPETWRKVRAVTVPLPG